MSVAATAPRRTGPRVLAVLLAAVFLGVIGASAGYIVGTRVKQARAEAQGGQQPGGGRQPGGTGTVPATGRGTPAGPPCPQPTIELAHSKGAPAGPLHRVLYIETAKSEVWICRDAAGRLWYQGHRKSTPDARYPAEDLVDGRTSLLLSQVNVTVANQKDQYLAVNVDPVNGNQTRYAVTTERLLITGGYSSVEPVLRHEP
jgi:hypothetical protein